MHTTTGNNPGTSTLDWDMPNGQTLLATTTGTATTVVVGGPNGAASTGAGNEGWQALAKDNYGSITPSSSYTIARAAQYDPWGQPTSGRGHSPMPTLGYRSELQPDTTIDLRARYYQSSLGQFMIVDPLPPALGIAAAGNQYAYANNSPLNLVDPTGMKAALGEQTFHLAVGQLLQAPADYEAGCRARGIVDLDAAGFLVTVNHPDIQNESSIRVHIWLKAKLELLMSLAYKVYGVVLGGGSYRTCGQQAQTRFNNKCPDSWDAPSDSCKPETARRGHSMHEKGAAIDFTWRLAMDPTPKRLIGSQSELAFKALSGLNAPASFFFGSPTSGFLKNLDSEPWHWSTNGN